MHCPSPLKYGDTIGLIAPSSPIQPEKLLPCITLLSRFGFRVVLGQSCFQTLHGYLAGADELRATDINQMFSSPDIHAIFCLRGGYGSTRILSMLDYDEIRKHPKIFVGYSDITSFHLAFHKFCDFLTFHGPMVSSNMLSDFDDYSRQNFFSVLSMPKTYSFENPFGIPYEVIHPGKASGCILGGCLSLITPCIGTYYQPNFQDKILFLEDIGETIPRIDKMMFHLKHAGILNQVNGVLLGNFIDCDNPSDPSYSLSTYMKDFFHAYDKPVLFNLQSGHQKPMGTIPFGTLCSINTSEKNVTFTYP